MIANFSRKSQANIVLLFLYAVVLKVSIFTNITQPLVNNNDGIIYKFLIQKLHLLTGNGKVIAAVFAFFLLYLQGLKLAQIINNGKLMTKHNQLAAMSFLLITSLFKDWNVLSSALIVNTFILFIYGFITQLQNTSNPKTILFNIGMLIGLSNFIYTFSFTFLLLAIIGLITYRAFKLNEYLVLIVGYLLPYYCLFTYQYLSDSFDIHNFKLLFSMHLPKFANAKWVLASVLIIGILSLIGLYLVQEQNRKMNIQVRKSWGLMFFYLCISLCIPFF